MTEEKSKDEEHTFTGEYRDEACPLCGEDYDDLMRRKALERIGGNPKSGKLYVCHCCNSRVTEAQIDTGIGCVLDAVEDWGGEGMITIHEKPGARLAQGKSETGALASVWTTCGGSSSGWSRSPVKPRPTTRRSSRRSAGRACWRATSRRTNRSENKQRYSGIRD